jgi:hypothetical protein
MKQYWSEGDVRTVERQRAIYPLIKYHFLLDQLKRCERTLILKAL